MGAELLDWAGWPNSEELVLVFVFRDPKRSGLEVAVCPKMEAIVVEGSTIGGTRRQ